VTAVVIALFTLVLLGYVALPLLFPRQADRLPDLRDPLQLDLEEERDALFRAIREVEGRSDLPEARRDELRSRYEAKAAGVLRALEVRESELAGVAPAPRPPAPRRAPAALLGLLALALVSAAALGGFVLPRIGDDGLITTFFADDLATAEALRDLERAAERDPSTATLGALADAYWGVEEFERAEEVYLRLVAEVSPVPALAYQRLGLLNLQRDLDVAAEYLESARALDPNDLDTLFTLGEVAFARGDLEGARDAWGAFLALPDGDGAEVVRARLELLEAVAPLSEAVQADPSEANLLALADAFWSRDQQERAVDVYFQVLTTVNPASVTALGRTGELLFLRGRTDDAVGLLELAREADARGEGKLEPRALLFLGNAYFTLERFADAIGVWEAYLLLVDDPGRVPDLIASAEARLAEGGSPELAGGRELFVATCATCHGADGQGGSGPALAGNGRAADADLVESTVRFGRGAMPGFLGTLAEDEIALVVAYVAEELAPSGSR
jgi:mono/diheme cytochrome c family protein/thioredoxin-like negative regulator of GroEL